MIFTYYRKVLVLNFSVVGNTVFFWVKKLMERSYLLVTEKFLFWTFRWWEIRSFFQPKRWWKDDIYLVFLSFPWYSRTWEIRFFVRWSPGVGEVSLNKTLCRNYKDIYRGNNTNKFFGCGSSKKNKIVLSLATWYNSGLLQNCLHSGPFIWTWEYSNKKYENWKPKIIGNYLKQCFYQKQCWKFRSKSSKCFIQFNDFHGIRMSFVCSFMSLECTRTSLVCHSYVLVRHPCATSMYLYVTRMYFYVIHMSLLYTGMLSMYSYVTSKYSYVVYMSIVFDFTINQIKYRLTRKCFSLVSLETIHIKSSVVKVCSNTSTDKPVVKWLPNGIILYRTKVKNYTVKIRQK